MLTAHGNAMSSFGLYASIAMGGAAGACLRFFLSQMAIQLFGKGFPFGTLLVNVLGSFILGLLYSLIEQGQLQTIPWRSLVGVGFLGALTTFSTFSVETVMLLQQGEWVKSIVNVFVNVIFCLFAAWLGMQIVKG
jgi:CrcB protein